MYKPPKIREQVKTALTRAEHTVRSYFYDARHRKEAMDAVAYLERYGGTKLTPQIRKIADDYATETFGSKRFAPWLYAYTLIRGSFQEGWLPDNFYGRVVLPQVNSRLLIIGDFKTFSNTVLQSDLFPDIAYFIDGILYGRDKSVIDLECVRDLIPSDQQFVFLKQDGSQSGLGVARVTRDALSSEHFETMGNCVVQTAIEQHPFFDEIVPGPLTTLRVTTVRDNAGRIEARAAVIKAGRAGFDVYETNHSIRAPIVDDDGTLGPLCYDEDFRPHDAHPDTGFHFADRKVVGYAEMTSACVALHKKVPQMAVIGWDVAFDRHDTVKFVEWNTGHADIILSEAANGPLFCDLGWEKLRTDRQLLLD